MDLDKLAKPFLKTIQSYKPGRPIEEVQRERGLNVPFIKLASNENPRTPHEKIKQAIVKALDNVNRYPESGAPELTGRIASLHGVSTEEIFVGHGSNEILDLLVRAYVHDDENCVYSKLSFPIYGLICKQCGVGGIEVRCREWTHDLRAMAKAINKKTKLVFVCNPNNPTSTYNTAAEVDKFLSAIPDSLLVVLDEAYHEFVNAKDYPDTMSYRDRMENIVILRTFSKFYSLAGLRIGYAIADPRVVQTLHRMRQPFNVSRIAQAAAIAAIECRDDLRDVVNATIREREAVREAILEMNCICPPSQTNFLFVIPKDYSGDVCELLLDRGIIVRSMAPFGAAKNSFRVSMGTPEENRRLVEALRDVLAQGR